MFVGSLDISGTRDKVVETYFPESACALTLPQLPGIPEGVACFIDGTLYASYRAGSCMQLVSYNFAAKAWNLRPCSQASHGQFHPYACVDKRIYYYDDDNPEYFDTVDQTWRLIAKPALVTSGGSCMSEVNNVLYVFGGSGQNGIQVHNPDTNKWSVLWATLLNHEHIACHQIPGTANILVAYFDANGRVATFYTATNKFSGQVKDTTYFCLPHGKILVYGPQMYAYSGLVPDATYAYCANDSYNPMHRVIDTPGFSNNEATTDLIALVPISLLNLPTTCSPTIFKC